jgi:hypothetical protein
MNPGGCAAGTVGRRHALGEIKTFASFAIFARNKMEGQSHAQDATRRNKRPDATL